MTAEIQVLLEVLLNKEFFTEGELKKKTKK